MFQLKGITSDSDSRTFEKIRKVESIDLSLRSSSKVKAGVQAWCPDLNSLMVTLNLVDDENDTLSMSSTESHEILKKTVRFGTIDVREYAVIQGDHPFCKDGLALSLDWQYRQLESVRIDETVDGEEYEDMEYNQLLEAYTENDVKENSYRYDNVDYINTRPRRLNYFERRLVLEQVGYIVEDCYGDIRSSIWLGIDNELPPDDDCF
mmetsp:Transcript_38980/g.44470  ORF Transcript_38980/g.44470 Transcript_38980/m.44470 type:complete len:207 (-) Transcript_38980:123-743(-)